MKLTVAEIRNRLAVANAEEFAVYERTYCADTRMGVRDALAKARRRIEAQHAEEERVRGMYAFESEISDGGVCIGLDEVGRGPLAGPLTVAAVVLPHSLEDFIYGLNDSKQLKPEVREELALAIREKALAYSVQHVQPDAIDACGMTASLRYAFLQAIKAVEDQGVVASRILLDGNPLHLDSREVNIVKGDTRCASIAAASIIAKVERDRIMCDYAAEFPHYGFADNKGYGSAAHIEAIKRYGLCAIHRVSFCSAFTQESLF